MSEQLVDGQQKFQNYRTQFNRLKRALDNEFYLEAIFIEYAILEDRTESLLRHAGLWDAYMNGRNQASINTKLTFIKKYAGQKTNLLSRYFSDDLLETLRGWKNERNPLIHDLLNQKLGPDQLQDLALRGNDLIRVLRTRVTNYNRALEKQQGK